MLKSLIILSASAISPDSLISPRKFFVIAFTEQQ